MQPFVIIKKETGEKFVVLSQGDLEEVMPDENGETPSAPAQEESDDESEHWHYYLVAHVATGEFDSIREDDIIEDYKFAGLYTPSANH